MNSSPSTLTEHQIYSQGFSGPTLVIVIVAYLQALLGYRLQEDVHSEVEKHLSIFTCIFQKLNILQRINGYFSHFELIQLIENVIASNYSMTSVSISTPERVNFLIAILYDVCFLTFLLPTNSMLLQWKPELISNEYLFLQYILAKMKTYHHLHINAFLFHPFLHELELIVSSTYFLSPPASTATSTPSVTQISNSSSPRNLSSPRTPHSTHNNYPHNNNNNHTITTPSMYVHPPQPYNNNNPMSHNLMMNSMTMPMVFPSTTSPAAAMHYHHHSMVPLPAHTTTPQAVPQPPAMRSSPTTGAYSTTRFNPATHQQSHALPIAPTVFPPAQSHYSTQQHSLPTHLSMLSSQQQLPMHDQSTSQFHYPFQQHQGNNMHSASSMHHTPTTSFATMEDTEMDSKDIGKKKTKKYQPSEIELHPIMSNFLTKLRKENMDIIFPSSIHDMILVCIYVAFRIFKVPTVHRDLIRLIMHLKESGYITGVEHVSKTKIRGVLAILKQGDLVIKSGAVGDAVQLNLSEEIVSFERLRDRHDHFLLTYLMDSAFHIPEEMVRELVWKIDAESKHKRSQALEELISKLIVISDDVLSTIQTSSSNIVDVMDD